MRPKVNRGVAIWGTERRERQPYPRRIQHRHTAFPVVRREITRQRRCSSITERRRLAPVEYAGDPRIVRLAAFEGASTTALGTPRTDCVGFAGERKRQGSRSAIAIVTSGAIASTSATIV
jgi:hypothetical protein